MNFKKFNKLFDKILNSKRKRKSLIKNVKLLYKTNFLSDKEFLNFIKILILINFYYPKKYNICIKLINKFLKLSELRRIKLLNLISTNFNFDSLDDKLIKKIIFSSFNLFIFIKNYDFFTIWINILNNLSKIKIDNNSIKSLVYIQIITESILIVKNKHSLNKIIDYSSKTIKLINQN